MGQHNFGILAAAWQLEWIIPAAGMAVAALAFCFGWSLARSRHHREAAGHRNTPADPLPSSPTEQWAALRRTAQVGGGPGPERSEPVQDPYALGSLSEQRLAPRRTGNAIGLLLRDPEGKGPERSGWVLDRSVGGLSIQLDGALEPGTVWQVRPRKAPEGTPWIKVEVRSCVMEDGAWKIGCQFEKTPTWNVLMLFG
jgi:hypothetical protein